MVIVAKYSKNLVTRASSSFKDKCEKSFLILILIILTPYVIAHLDPYETIGVRRDASQDQIKRAYREMAKRLHPDTSNLSEDEASRKFIELNKAHEILKDPQKRSRYDQFGETDENRHSRGFNSHQYQNRQSRDRWSGHTFTFFSSSNSQFGRKSINAHKFHNEYKKESRSRPFLIFFYSDFCSSCHLIQGTWFKIVDELAKYNVGAFTINVQYEPQLSRDLGISSIPHIACLMDGRVKSYYQTELSLGSIVKFVKSQFPSNLFQTLTTESDQDRFIAFGPQYNKLSAIIYSNDNIIKLRHQLIAFELRNYYRFGVITIKESKYLSFAAKYNVTTNLQARESLFLVFDENIKQPRISIHYKSDNFDMIELRNELRRWPFIKLPKLSSQSIFDDLCVYAIPKESSTYTRKLCIILFINEQPATQPIRDKLIEFINMNDLGQNDRVVFSYIDPIKQKDFVSSLITETVSTHQLKDVGDIESKIIMIERHPNDYRKAIYRWLSSRWNLKCPDELDRAKLELHEIIQSYKRGAQVLEHRVALTSLLDENGLSLFERIVWRIIDYMLNTISYLTSRESFYTVVILLVLACISCLFLYQAPMSNLPNTEDMIPPSNFTRSHKYNSYQTSNNHSPVGTNFSSCDEMRLMELKAETYFGMVLLLKPGFQSIVLLTDDHSKHILMPKFKKAIWPYRRNKTLLFGYLCLDKNLDWYKALMEDVLEVDINSLIKQNCIGTVLALNGFKNYIRVYHAKHHEIDHYDDETDNDGAFLGFNENDTESMTRTPAETIYTVENLLDKLPIWLDKTFDGMTKKYYVSEWPKEMK